MRYLILGFFVLGLFFVNTPTVLALDINLVSPNDGVPDVGVGESLQWTAVPGTFVYEINVDEFSSAEDSITPGFASCDGPPIGGILPTCSFPLPAFTVGTISRSDPLNLQTYTWQVIAKNVQGVPIANSPTRTFTTEENQGSTFSICAGPSLQCLGVGGSCSGTNSDWVEDPTLICFDPPAGVCCRDTGGGSTTTPPPATNSLELTNPISANSLGQLFNLILTFITTLAVLVLPLVVIYAAYMLVSGRGDPQQVVQARTMLMWAAIAFIIVLLARGIPIILRNLL